MKPDDPMGNTVKIQVTFYGGLEHIFKKQQAQVDFKNAGDVRSLLEYLCVSNECRTKLFDDNGHLQPNITVVKNGRNIRFLNELDTRLGQGDTISLFPPVAGG